MGRTVESHDDPVFAFDPVDDYAPESLVVDETAHFGFRLLWDGRSNLVEKPMDSERVLPFFVGTGVSRG